MARFFGRIWHAIALAGLIALPAQTALAGYAHVVLDANSGKVLLARNADVKNYPASLTKMMTLYMTFQAIHSGRLGWNTKVTMTRRGAATVPSKLGIPAGHKFTVREAVNAMIVRSANDVAEAMCDHLSGKRSCGAFLTAGARRLGMRQTTFRNGSGLTASGQLSTARDMSKLGLALIRDFPHEYKLFSQRSFKFRGKRIKGHNHLMARYRGMDGIKTGYTSASGFNIVTAVRRNGKRVVGVVFGGRTARSRDDRMAELLDAAMPKATNRVARNFRVPIPLERPTQGRVTVAARSEPANLPIPVSRPGFVAEIKPPASIPTTAQKANGNWEIQIAAVDSQRAASRLLQRARSDAPNRLTEVDAYSQPVQTNGKTLYRARFAGFDNRNAAHSACKDLKQRAYECMVVGNNG